MAAAAGEADAERLAVLERRRALRKAKKAKGKAFREEKHRQRVEKKQEIVAKIRAKRDEALAAKGLGRNGGKGYGKGNGYGNGYSNGNGNEAEGAGCWICGEPGHQKQDCTNRGAADLNKTCFQCRRRGHTSANCPTTAIAGNGTNLCFNCGSSGHQLRDCREPRVNGGATYATCFVCNQTGHLSSRCPQSSTGVYPRGGCCKVCRSIEHLARDCPVGNIASDGSSGVKRNSKKTFADEDEDAEGAATSPTAAGADAVASTSAFDTTGDALDDLDVKLDGDDDADQQPSEKQKRKAAKAGAHLFGNRAARKRVKF